MKKFCLTLVAIIMVVSVAAGAKKPAKQPCVIVAHRGFSAAAPENTLEAAMTAINAGCDGSECDVRKTCDGALVILHDEKVDRTSNGKGMIDKMTFAQVRKLDAGKWKDQRYAGAKIPTLQELLSVHQNTDCAPVVEIKIPGISKEVVDAIRQAGLIDQTVVISFNHGVVKEVRTLEPKLRCSWLCGKELKGTVAEQANWITKKARACKTPMVDLSYKMLSKELVDELHKRGLIVWAWTIDDPKLIDQLLKWKIDGITTNRPDLAMQHRNEAMKSWWQRGS